MAQNEKIDRAQCLGVIGGSAGGLHVLLQILPQLTASDSCAIIIVLHRPSQGDGQLSTLLNLKTAWRVKEAEDKDVLHPNSIYLAPGGYHLLVEKDRTLSLDSSEKINFSRPAIDPTFETAADAFGGRLNCLLISGANADGVSGLMSATMKGARVAVQNPLEAQVALMPASAVGKVPELKILNVGEMASFLTHSPDE